MAEGFLQVLGLMRWSYPSAPDAFSIPGGLDDIRAELYSDARLTERMFYLEHVLLPCLAAQTDQNFRVVMLMGDRMPEAWRSRVLAAISAVPQITPVFAEEGQQHRLACREAMIAHRARKAGAVAEFRLDDDDAICVDFVEHVRRTFRRHRGLLDAQGKFCIDYTRGLAMVTDEAGVSLTPLRAHLWVASLALIYPPSHPKSLIDYPHKRLWMAMPNISFPGQISWIRGVHRSNDSAIGDRLDNMPGWNFEPGSEGEILMDRFGIDWEPLRAAWGELQAGRAA